MSKKTQYPAEGGSYVIKDGKHERVSGTDSTRRAPKHPAALPHPGPLPEGEGEKPNGGSAALTPTLSQGEREQKPNPPPDIEG
jgi:hypothetical protein